MAHAPYGILEELGIALDCYGTPLTISAIDGDTIERDANLIKVVS
jgi:hypothetical protein